MNTLTLQKNRLLLAGIVAFAFLILTQISVMAYHDNGVFSTARSIGGYDRLTIGNQNVDSSLNIGTTPMVSTGTPTHSGATATLNGGTTSMGVATSTYRYFEWYQDSDPVQSTPQSSTLVIGTYSDTVTFDTLKPLNVRAVTQVGTVKSYGAWETLTPSNAVGGNFLWQILPFIIAAAIVISMLIVFRNGIDPATWITVLASGLVAYIITVLLVNAFFG